MDAVLGLTLAAILLVAFVESALLPLPLTVLMAPAVYEFREQAVWFIVVATVGSALGSLGGAYLGRWRGEAVLRRVVSEERFNWTERVYGRHGTFALALAAISPLPYIPFTLSSGIYGTDYRTILFVATTGRGLKYAVEVLALLWLTSLDLTTIFAAAGATLVVGYLVWNHALEDAVLQHLEPEPG